MQIRHKQQLFWLTLILLLATLARLNGILSQSFWIDEGFTWNLTQYSDMFAILRQDVHPPLYFIMIDWWVEIAGTSQLSMRYFSFLPGIISIVMVYRLACEIEIQRDEKNSLIPLIASALMAVAEAETYVAHEARSYSWHILFACLSMWGFLRWSRQSQKKYLTVWIISTIALIYTFYLGAFIGIAQGLYTLLFLRRKKLMIAIGALVFSAMSLMPWLLITAGEQAGNISRGEVIERSAYGFWLIEFSRQYFTRLWFLTIALLISGIVIIKDKKIRLHETGILLLLWFGIPLTLTLILNEIVPTYQPVRVSQIVPAITLLIAFGVGHFQGKIRWAFVAILLIYSTVSTDFWRYKQEWSAMVEDTVHLIADDTPMLFELGGDDYAPRYHYGNELENSFDFLLDDGEAQENANVLIGLTTWRHLRPEEYQGSLPAIINSQNHWWLFYWSSDTGALNWLETFGFERTAMINADFNLDVFLYRYDRLPEMPIVTYDNGLILHDAIVHDDLAVELLWSTETALDTDFTTSLILLDENEEIIARNDSQPFMGERPMTGWEINEIVYDPKQLEVTPELADGDYMIKLVVYHTVDDSIVPLSVNTGEDAISLGNINLSND